MGKKNNIRTVLIAPLDWGLGHTTRCIPLINLLQQLGFQLYIACSYSSEKVLLREFPNREVLHIRGYNIRYSSSKRLLPFKILQQLPKILLTIQYEHAWLQKVIDELKIDLIISDNRFGLYTKKIPCIFITHQLNILSPNIVLNRVIQIINYSFINRYTECWVPDFKGELNLAGTLSHPKKLPSIQTRYLGPLSRFERSTERTKKYSWLMILSGPEPQRTILEEKLLRIIPSMEENILLVRGKPGSEEIISVSENCMVLNHIETSALQIAFEESEFVLSRAGYTTVMEVLTLQKKAVFIPTPGQTEQEYLAKHLMNQSWCYSFEQDSPDYLSELMKAKNFCYQLPTLPSESFPDVIKEFLFS